MFEKEAEEAIMKKYPSSVQGYKSLIKNWKDGAEFGYNKANEWHYVKGGDLPKSGVKVLSEQGTLVFYKGDCFCWFEYSPNADNIKLRKWEEPIAWKEIVLPKESE